LTEQQLDAVPGGTGVSHGDIVVVKTQDAASLSYWECARCTVRGHKGADCPPIAVTIFW
jgi:hypothetical protein